MAGFIFILIVFVVVLFMNTEHISYFLISKHCKFSKKVSLAF